MGETRVKKSKKKDKESSRQMTPIATQLQGLSIDESTKSIDRLPLANPTIKQPKSKQSLRSKHSINSLSSEHSEEDIDQSVNYIEIIDTDTKGQAAFATRKIRPGTLILAERPLIRLTQAQEDADKASNDNTDHNLEESTFSTHLNSAFSSLPRSDQKAYLKLFDSNKSGFSRIKSIYYSNCYNLSTPPSTLLTSTSTDPSYSIPEGGSCIGPLASRLNHSCFPNVQFSYSPSLNLMLFHAIRAIPRGKELVSSYESVYAVSATRQTKLSMYYGFRCQCEACVPVTEFWEKSDERRRGMLEGRKRVGALERGWGRIEGDGDGDGDERGRTVEEALRELGKLEGSMVKEGLFGVPLADVYGCIAVWAGRKGDRLAEREAIKKELDVCRICLGSRADRVRMLRDSLGQIDIDIDIDIEAKKGIELRDK